jgi:hypothetical protein
VKVLRVGSRNTAYNTYYHHNEDPNPQVDGGHGYVAYPTVPSLTSAYALTANFFFPTVRRKIAEEKNARKLLTVSEYLEKPITDFGAERKGKEHPLSWLFQKSLNI